MFPATPDFEAPSFEHDEPIYIYFLCFDPAYAALGRLTQCEIPDLRRGLLYSLGLASTIVISREPGLLPQILTVVGADPRATETWTVVQGVLTSIDCHCTPSEPFRTHRFLVRSYDALPLTERAVVDEFVASIGLLVPKLAAHIPAELAALEKIVDKVNELIDEMLFVTAPGGAVPGSLNEYTEADFTADSGLGEMILHQNAERLVQINAALSYLATQATSGAIPILERRSLIRRYSLLGIGSAILAILRIARSIEKAFASAALEVVLESFAENAAPLPGLDFLPSYDASNWGDNSLGRWDGKISPREPYPKLPYFSGRFGFRETEYTISAAIHSLSSGGTPQWSLLTLTHEILHGHVRNLLSLVFQGDPSTSLDGRWTEYYVAFEARIVNGERDAHLLASIRTIILTYCCLSITHGSLTREGISSPDRDLHKELKRDFWLPIEESLWATVEREFRNISEILVHVLDLHYFYRSSLDRYIPLIWSSWASLPQVRGDPRQYVLRSLLVIASKEHGSPYERFEIAVNHLRRLLDPLSANDRQGSSTVRAALALLPSLDVAQTRLFRAFSASLLLVDLANSVVFVPRIRGDLQGGDEHVVPIADPARMEEWFDYVLGDDFEDDRVKAPPAFLADRLARALESPASDSLEEVTVKLFLACCSDPTQEN